MRRFYICIILLFCCSAIAFDSYCQSFDYSENSVYIFNFIRYTSWPNNQNTIKIGIVGITPVEGALKDLISKKTNSNSTYTVRRITMAEVRDVDVVVIAQSATAKVKAIADLTAGAPILIITEKENMGRMGACISFFFDEDNDFKTGYQLSLRNCKLRGLSVNEQILNNAELIW